MRFPRLKSFTESIPRDVLFGLRSLRKHPGFTFVVIGTLALGIGAGTAIFSVVQSVLLRPLPYPDADRVVMLWERGPKLGGERDGTSVLFYNTWAEEQTVFSDLGYLWHMNYITLEFNLVEDGQSQRLNGRYVSPSFFDVLGVPPLLGRTLTTDEDIRNPAPVAIISHRFWQQRFNGDPDVLNTKLPLENYGSRRTYSIVGVMPEDFRFPGDTDVWAPAGLFRTPPHRQKSTVAKGHDLFVVARLKPGVSLERARSEMNAIAGRFAKKYPDAWSGSQVDVTPLRSELYGKTRTAYWILFAAVGAVLLIACANLANLLLFRATTRTREIAMRTALGASRWRIMRQLMTETLILAMIGGTLGVVLAYWGVDLLARSVPANDSGQSHSEIILASATTAVRIDWLALLVASVATISVGVMFGLAPAVLASKTDMIGALKEGGRSGTTGRSTLRLHGSLLAAQIAAALVLLIGAGLAIQSFAKLTRVDPGFESEHLLAGHVDFVSLEYRDLASRVQFSRQLLERLEALPGVTSAGGIHEFPMNKPGRWTRVFKRKGQTLEPEGVWPVGDTEPVTPNYFKTMGIPLHLGREFTHGDTPETGRKTILNQKLANLLWPDGENPIGQTIELGLGEGIYWLQYEVVGVVANTRSLRLDQEAPAIMYMPFAQAWPQAMSRLNVAIRTTVDPASLIETVRRTALDIDPDFPLQDLRPASQIVDEKTAAAEFQMSLLSLLGFVALALAALGIYGVVSYYVSQRRTEIGVRMALGAGHGDVLRQVVLHGLKLTLLGIVPGLVGAWGLARIVQSQLYETPAVNPLVFGGTALLLLIVSAAACFIPAQRATRVDPMIVLREE